MEDQQLWGSDAEWESGSMLGELKATLRFSSNSGLRPFLFMKLPPGICHNLLDSFCNYLFQKRSRLGGKAVKQFLVIFITCVILIIVLSFVAQPPEDIHHLYHYARGVAVASYQSQSLLGHVKVQPFLLFRDFLPLNFVQSAKKSHQQQFAFHTSRH